MEAARELAGISARELDKLIGVSPGYCSRIESGDRPDPGSMVSERIARVFGLSLDWLISGVGPSPTVRTVAAAVAKSRKPTAR